MNYPTRYELKALDAWSDPVTPQSVLDIPPEHGFQDQSGALWRPTGFVTLSQLHNPWIDCIDSDGNRQFKQISDVPYMKPFTDFAEDAPPGPKITLRHRKGQKEGEPIPAREDSWRILGICALTQIRYGEHPEHPNELGFYVFTCHLGRLALPKLSTPEYLDAELICFKSFPIPARVTVGCKRVGWHLRE